MNNPHIPSRRQRLPRRRTIAAAVAAATAATGTLALGVGAAHAATVDLTDVTFEWGISQEVGAKAPPFGGCNFLSAGASDGTQAAYQATAGDVAVARVDGATPTWANKCTGVGNDFQKVVWSGGTGTADPATGEAIISFTGELSINFYGGLTPFTIEDPVLTVDADGDGQLVATVFGWGSSMDDPMVKVPLDPMPGVVVADLTGVDVAGTGFTVTPDYAGVEFEADGWTPQNRTNEGWGSWPESFVLAHAPAPAGTGLTSYWYSSGGAADPYKAPAPMTFGYADIGGEGSGGGGGSAPGADEQVVTVEVPDSDEPGEFTWTITGDGIADLGTATDEGTHLGATGEIDQIVVSDNRDTPTGWGLAGQVSDFTGGLSGKHLGWTPSLVSSDDPGVFVGFPVAPSLTDGAGLTSPVPLAVANNGSSTGGTTVVGADLDLQLPIDTPAGTYSATLTITAVV